MAVEDEGPVMMKHEETVMDCWDVDAGFRLLWKMSIKAVMLTVTKY